MPHEAKLATRALVVVELRVGVAHFVHRHKLRAEAIESEGPVVDGEVHALGAGVLSPLWTQPYMTAESATIEHAAIKLRVSFVFFMAPRLSSF